MNTCNIVTHHVLPTNCSQLQSATDPTSLIKGGHAMIIQTPRIKPQCPQCGSQNVKSKLSFTNIVAWLGRIMGVPTVKIWEKRCSGCGHEFQVFGKWEVSARSCWGIEADLKFHKTGLFDLSLAFLIRIWKGSMGLHATGLLIERWRRGKKVGIWSVWLF